MALRFRPSGPLGDGSRQPDSPDSIMTSQVLAPLTYWIDRAELSAVPTAEYWNDLGTERQKQWWVDDASDMSTLDYLRDGSNLEEGFLAAIHALERERPVAGTVVDLASGTCWTSAVLSNFPDVEKIYAIDISLHRLEVLAPIIFEQYNAQIHKIERVLGSFYSLDIPERSVDLVVMCEAYHHAQDPRRLMMETKRILKPTGAVLITGERPVPLQTYLRTLTVHTTKSVLWLLGLRRIAETVARRQFRPLANPFATATGLLYPADREKGDQLYRQGELTRLCRSLGFRVETMPVKCGDDKRVATTANFLLFQ